MTLDKAMIIIAVSHYSGGGFNNLPGAINSAQRLRNWAEQASDDCNYNVLYLGDDEVGEDKQPGQPGAITVDFLKTEIHNFLSNNIIDRLIVYFAGHGVLRSFGNEFWILTHGGRKNHEGIDVEAFRRALGHYNIGSHNDDLSNGQLVLIGDACRNTSALAVDFQASSILDNDEQETILDIDRFFSTRPKQFSYQIDPPGKPSYLLFTETLVDALEGKEDLAIEREFHKFSPVVTNDKLKDYLRSEVPKRASELDLDMCPDVAAGVSPPHNYYNILDDENPKQPDKDDNGQRDDPPANPVYHDEERYYQLEASFSLASSLNFVSNNEAEPEITETSINNLSLDIESEYRGGIQENSIITNMTVGNWWDIKRLKIPGPALRLENNEVSEFRIYCDYLPSEISVPNDGHFKVCKRGGSFVVNLIRTTGLPVLIKHDSKWMVVPDFPSLRPVLSSKRPGDILFRTSSRPYQWEYMASDYALEDGRQALRLDQINTYADSSRRQKHSFPHESVIAAYLYERSGDRDNIVRTAHFMARNPFYGYEDRYWRFEGTPVVPFDLALLCASSISWTNHEGSLVAFANLPGVGKGNDTNRPNYTQVAFPPADNVRLWGICPTLTEGWKYLLSQKHLNVPERIKIIGQHISSRSASILDETGKALFENQFNYRTHQVTQAQMI